MNKETFINELTKINININENQLEQLSKYYAILKKENEKYNLTTITEEQDVYLKHFYDSLTIAKYIYLKDQKIIDLGTGAGFPGIVLKIIYPELKMTLLDATLKKCHFLEYVINELSLKDIIVINERAEEYSLKVRENYDIVVSRAVAPLKHLLEYGIPLLKIDGLFVSLKGNIKEELTNIDNYYQKLSIKEQSINEFLLPVENSKRTIYIATKTGKTNKMYPRKYSQIKKYDI